MDAIFSMLPGIGAVFGAVVIGIFAILVMIYLRRVVPTRAIIEKDDFVW